MKKEGSIFNEEVALILGNNIRFWICFILKNVKSLRDDKRENIIISQVMDQVNNAMNSNYTYKAIYKQIKILEKHGYVNLKKESGYQGRPVFVVPNLKKFKELEEGVDRIILFLKKESKK